MKSHGGQWIIRLEDVDTARCRAEWADAQLRDLAALGLVSDAPVVRQSQRGQLYRAALDQLARRGNLYRCGCSRKDLQVLASAPHAEDGVRPYPGRCRAAKVSGFVGDALRAELPPGAVEWLDLLLGAQTDDPATATGDPVLHRRDGCFAYHLAVVVDAAAQGVASLTALNQRGVGAAMVVGRLGWSLGCLPRPEACRAEDLIERFSWSQVSATPRPVPKDSI